MQHELNRRVRELNTSGLLSENEGKNPQEIFRNLVRDLLQDVFLSLSDQGSTGVCRSQGPAVESLGYAYELLLRYRLERAVGPSLSLRSPERLGAPITLNLAELLAVPPAARHEWLSEQTGRKLSRGVREEVEAARTVRHLEAALSSLVEGELTPGAVPAGSLVLQPSLERRRSGSHYTPRQLAEIVVRRTLAPLLAGLTGPKGEPPRPEDILALRVCDPALGSGVFLLETCRQLAAALVESWRRHGRDAAMGGKAENGELADHADGDEHLQARWLVARRCLYGVDRDPMAVEVARMSLWLLAGGSLLGPEDSPSSFLAHALKCGDALVESTETPAGVTPFDWEGEFPEVFARESPGFDAVVSNPPWVSYVGRARQPLDPALKAYYRRKYRSFRGYRNLQGLFVERSLELTRAGGRLGLVLPSSMAELDGYAPVRALHDQYAEPDAELADFGEDSFQGVFQPCMALTSTVKRRAESSRCSATGKSVPGRAGARRHRSRSTAPPWPLERSDLNREGHLLLEHLSSLPPLPPELFGERGLQTTRGDYPYLTSKPDAAAVPLRVGGDVLPFRRGPASLWVDPAWFDGRLRPPGEWVLVRLLIRQTARVPIAALSDGLGFRNSLLAGFEVDGYPAAFLVAYLNSTPIRWLHYHRNRDARMGMPQVKVSHLRALPAPLSGRDLAPLAALGGRLSARNAGITTAEQRALDELVARCLGLGTAQLAYMWADAEKWLQWSHLVRA